MPHILELDDFREWSREKWIEYASDSTRSGQRKRLSVNLFGSRRVTLGADVVYDGQNISDAIRAYNELG